MKIVIAGNSNSGKTTLYNTLTGQNAHVGNWHGVTVDALICQTKIKGEKFEIVDLPGLNSFDSYTMEEKISVDYLKKGDYDVIINVVEATHFDTSLTLTKDLLSINKPIVCVINMYDELVKRGGSICIDKLQDCGIKFLICNLTKRKEVEKIICVIKTLKIADSNIDFKYIYEQYNFGKIQFSKADNLLTNTLSSIFIFAITIGISFYIAFGKYGIGKLLSDLIIDSIDKLSNWVNALILSNGGSDFFARFISNGIINALGVVLGFLPPIIILNFVLIYLEQSGIISRFSFIFDNTLSKFGLNGRALFALIMGFGCTTIAVVTSNGLENKKVKNRLIMGLPFISCSAKVPVYLYICSRLLNNVSFLVILLIYLAGLILSLIVCYLNLKLTNERQVPMILELPTLRIKCLKSTLKPLINSVKQFIIKVCTIIVLISITIFLLSSISINFTYLTANEIDKSLLSIIGRAFSVLLKPIGVDNYKIGTALVAGMFAKEAVLSTIANLNITLNLTIASTLSLITFIAFYPPCLSCLVTMKREMGIINTICLFFFQLLTALFLSYFVYFLINNLLISVNIILLIVIILVVINLYKHRKKECIR